MPKYTLTYFNGRGRGEVARLLFAAAGVEYKDVRVEMAEWPALKAKTLPFHCLPTLDVEGGPRLGQSYAINRYLANEFGFAGKNAVEKAQVDMVADAMVDLVPDLAKILFTPEDKKAEVTKETLEKKLPPALENVERILSENNGGKAYLVGSSLSWADLVLLGFADSVEALDKDFMKKFAKLAALVDRLRQEPKIKKWRESRPESPF